MLADKKHIYVKFSQAKLKKRHEALAILYDIGSDLTSSLCLTEILDRAIIKVIEHYKKVFFCNLLTEMSSGLSHHAPRRWLSSAVSPEFGGPCFEDVQFGP